MKKFIKKLIPSGLFRRIEPAGHLLEAVLLNVLNGFPARGMNVIGVTGTDGKTTTTMLIAQMLRESGYKVAVLTTISVDYGDGQGEQPSPSHMTTASAKSLLGMLKKIKAAGVDWVVLETSSHALAQHRVWGVPYSVAVLTNLSHEHLDYHGTFQRYRDAKRRLFKLASRNKRGLRAGIINADDPSAEYFVGDTARPLTYGLKAGDLQAKNIKLHSGGSRYVVRVLEEGREKPVEYRIECKIPGRFNVYNSLAAVGVGLVAGLSKDQIEKGIAALRGVPGRMHRLEIDKPFDVYIDYAVTPAALESVLKAARETATGKVRLVFGATGDRDKLKRPVMGKIAAELADAVYLTDDETHTEDAASIRRAVFGGIEEAGGAGKARVFDDRGDAIAAALEEAKKGDAVLITGLGHQITRNMGGVDEPWSDSDKVIELLSD